MLSDIKSLWDGISAGMLAEAGFADDDYVMCSVDNRIITLKEYTGDDAEELATELPDDLFIKWSDLKEGEAAHVEIEEGKITISPITLDEIMLLMVFGRKE